MNTTCPPSHDVRRIYRTDGTGTTFLYCVTCGAHHDEAPATARCAEHPAYESDYCPVCGTAARIS